MPPIYRGLKHLSGKEVDHFGEMGGMGGPTPVGSHVDEASDRFQQGFHGWQVETFMSPPGTPATLLCSGGQSWNVSLLPERQEDARATI